MARHQYMFDRHSNVDTTNFGAEDMLALLYRLPSVSCAKCRLTPTRLIELTEASIDASIASLQEIQRNWN